MPALAAAAVAVLVVAAAVWPGGLLDRDDESPPRDVDTGTHPMTEDGRRIDVGLSDGSSFGPLETWAEVPCFSKECDETVYGMSGHL